MSDDAGEREKKAGQQLTLQVTRKALEAARLFTAGDEAAYLDFKADGLEEQLLTAWQQRILLELERIVTSNQVSKGTKDELVARAWVEVANLRSLLSVSDPETSEIIYQLGGNPAKNYWGYLLAQSHSPSESVDILVNWTGVALAQADAYAEKRWYGDATDILEHVRDVIESYYTNSQHLGLTADGQAVQMCLARIHLAIAIHKFNALKVSYVFLDLDDKVLISSRGDQDLDEAISSIKAQAESSLCAFKILRTAGWKDTDLLTALQAQALALLLDISAIQQNEKTFQHLAARELTDFFLQVAAGSHHPIWKSGHQFIQKIHRCVEAYAEVLVSEGRRESFSMACLESYNKIFSEKHPLRALAAPLFVKAYYGVFLEAISKNDWNVAEASGDKCLESLASMWSLPRHFASLPLAASDAYQLGLSVEKTLSLIKAVRIGQFSPLNTHDPKGSFSPLHCTSTVRGSSGPRGEAKAANTRMGRRTDPARLVGWYVNPRLSVQDTKWSRR